MDRWSPSYDTSRQHTCRLRMGGETARMTTGGQCRHTIDSGVTSTSKYKQPQVVQTSSSLAHWLQVFEVARQAPNLTEPKSPQSSTLLQQVPLIPDFEIPRHNPNSKPDLATRLCYSTLQPDIPSLPEKPHNPRPQPQHLFLYPNLQP